MSPVELKFAEEEFKISKNPNKDKINLIQNDFLSYLRSLENNTLKSI
jgi:hypothetical protein